MKQMEKYYLLIALILFFLVSTTSSCKKESIEEQCAEEYLGEISLLESSRNSIPYNENTSLYFRDSLENETIFQIDMEIEGYKEKWNVSYHFACEFDNSIQKIYNIKIDQYRYIISESANTLDKQFALHLAPEPSYNPFNIDTISDQLGVYKGRVSNSGAYATNLKILVNPRNLSEDEIKLFQSPVDEITLLNRTFYDVYISLDSKEYYNYEKGLVAFRDYDEKLWVLDKTEKNIK